MNHLQNVIAGVLIGTISVACHAEANKVISDSSNTKCTANMRHDAPRKHLFFSMRDGKVLNGRVDKIPFSSRNFKTDGKLYYRGPRYTWVPEEYLVNMSVGCKSLSESILD